MPFFVVGAPRFCKSSEGWDQILLNINYQKMNTSLRQGYRTNIEALKKDYVEGGGVPRFCQSLEGGAQILPIPEVGHLWQKSAIPLPLPPVFFLNSSLAVCFFVL